MPSRPGGLIAGKISSVLSRSLNIQEVILCEQIALNFFVGPILTYIERLGAKPMSHSFDGIYSILARGTIKGARRGSRQHAMKGRLLNVYKKMDLYHPGMSDGELEATTMLADGYTDAEIDRAIVIARGRGVKHVRYVLGICKAHAGKPTERPKKPIEKFEDNIIRPDADVIAAAWENAVIAAQDKLRVNEAERAAKNGTF